MDVKIKVGNKEYPVRMRMLAAKEYRKLTSKNLLSQNAMVEIYGDGAGKEFDAELFIAFVYSMMIDGSHPAKLEISVDDVGAQLSVSDPELGRKLMRVYVADKLGKTIEEADAALEAATKDPGLKNVQASEGATK